MSKLVSQKLGTLLQQAGLQAASGACVPNIEVTGVAMDSRAVQSGDLFVALRGVSSHGLEYLDRALRGGAAAVLHDGLGHPSSTPGVPLIEVPGLAERCGQLASLVQQQPSTKIDVIGVTGTNGKTSSVHFLAQALTAIGHRVGTQGTLGSGLFGQLAEAERTTPDAAQTQRWLASMVAAGADCVAMEVSSHALAQGRVNGTRFKLAMFTNLSRDHLDYHLDMEDYYQAKARLFHWPDLDLAVINIDDPAGVRLLQATSASQQISYGLDPQAQVQAGQAVLSNRGMSFDLRWRGRQKRVDLPLLGQFNLHNALGVAAALLGLGHDLEVVARGLAALRPVPGRMQWLDGQSHGAVVVDYAHTPDALELALTALRAHCEGRLRVVFGCGGDRDAGKRSAMGAIAEHLADEVIISDDNPRSESPALIAEQIVQGCSKPDAIKIIHDRAKAIGDALEKGQAQDILLIAGKGHERTQEYAGSRRPFDDVSVARSWLERSSC